MVLSTHLRRQTTRAEYTLWTHSRIREIVLHWAFRCKSFTSTVELASSHRDQSLLNELSPALHLTKLLRERAIVLGTTHAALYTARCTPWLHAYGRMHMRNAAGATCCGAHGPTGCTGWAVGVTARDSVHTHTRAPTQAHCNNWPLISTQRTTMMPSTCTSTTQSATSQRCTVDHSSVHL